MGYLRDLELLHTRLLPFKAGFFLHSPFLRHVPKESLKTVWERFNAARDSLTRKQWNALEMVHLEGRGQTEAAKAMQISLDSFRDRMEGAELKFRKALPELAGLSLSVTFRISRAAPTLYWGLYRRSSAAKVHSLYRVKNGVREEIPHRVGKPKKKAKVNENRIKAWAVASSPMPDFLDTEFFLGTKPESAVEREKNKKAVHDRASKGLAFQDKARAHRAQQDFRALQPKKRNGK